MRRSGVPIDRSHPIIAAALQTDSHDEPSGDPERAARYSLYCEAYGLEICSSTTSGASC